MKSTINKRRQIERLKASSNIRGEKVDEALEDLEEATKFEETLAKRVDGISQNLHRGLRRHSKLAQDDILVALIENARSSILYEKQLLRELESLRTDFSDAAKPAPPPSQTVAPTAPAVRPLTPPQKSTGSWTISQSQPQQPQGPPLQPSASVVSSRNPLPHIQTQQAVNNGLAASVASNIQGPASSGPIPPNHRNTFQGTASLYASASTSAPPSAVTGSGYIEARSPLAPPISSPGAGPSNIRPISGRAGFGAFSPTSTVSARAASSSSHADGTKSMIITQAPLESPGSVSQISSTSGFDPLLSPGGGVMNTSASPVGRANGNGPFLQHQQQHPLAVSMMGPSGGQSPLHSQMQDSINNPLQASQYGTMRRKLDAREAAAKLANFL